jgi:hypothetical protein
MVVAFPSTRRRPSTTRRLPNRRHADAAQEVLARIQTLGARAPHVLVNLGVLVDELLAAHERSQ